MNPSNDTFMSLEEENIYEFKRIGIPTLLYLLILCIVGTIGNLHVLLVYSLRYKANIYKTFILCLASVDFLACTFCIPSVIFIILHPNTIQSLMFCKISKAFDYFVGACSLSLLDVIAVERYRKICQATHTQFTVRTARILCAIVIVFVFVVAVIPVTVIYGINQKKTYYHSLEGYECTVLNEFKNSTFAKVYRGILFLIFIFLLVACVSLYSLVGRKIYAHQKKHQTQRKGNSRDTNIQVSFECDGKDSNQCSQETEFVTSNGNLSLEDTNLPLVKLCNIQVTEITSQGANTPNEDTSNKSIPTLQDPNKRESTILGIDDKAKCSEGDKGNSTLTGRRITHLSPKKRTNKLSRSRSVTFIFLVVSLISFGGYLPYLIITLMRNIDRHAYDTFSRSAPSLDLFIEWMVFLNNAVNPLVYGFIDMKFRKKCKDMYTKAQQYVCPIT